MMMFMIIMIIIVIIILNNNNNHHRHNNMNHHPDNIYLGLHSYPNLYILSQSLSCFDIHLLWRPQVRAIGSGLLFYLKCFLEKLITISIVFFFFWRFLTVNTSPAGLWREDCSWTGTGKTGILALWPAGNWWHRWLMGAVFSTLQWNKH